MSSFASILWRCLFFGVFLYVCRFLLIISIESTLFGFFPDECFSTLWPRAGFLASANVRIQSIVHHKIRRVGKCGERNVVPCSAVLVEEDIRFTQLLQSSQLLGGCMLFCSHSNAPSSCVTPAGTSNELDVQNEWEENTHTVMCNLINTHSNAIKRLNVRSTRYFFSAVLCWLFDCCCCYVWCNIFFKQGINYLCTCVCVCVCVFSAFYNRSGLKQLPVEIEAVWLPILYVVSLDRLWSEEHLQSFKGSIKNS